jgi:hypothetical protein
MPDIVVTIYLCFLIFSSLIFLFIHPFLWFFQRQKPRQGLLKAKLFWRNIFFLISGVVGWYCFHRRLLDNWLIFGATGILLAVSIYAAGAVDRFRSKNVANNRAA